MTNLKTACAPNSTVEEMRNSTHAELEILVQERTAQLAEATRRLEEDIAQRKKIEGELRESEMRFRNLLEMSSDWYWEQDDQFRNTSLSNARGGTSAGTHLIGVGRCRWDNPQAKPLQGGWEEHKELLAAHLPFRDFEYELTDDEGNVIYRSVTGEPIFQDGTFKGYRGVGRDITKDKLARTELQRRNAELTEANEKLSMAQQQLIQSEKLASIGQLAAGVAHEINNPIGYVFSNFGTLDEYLQRLFEMLLCYEDAEKFISSPEKSAQLETLRERVELDFLKTDIPVLMQESREGLERVRQIVRDLKDFSRSDTGQEWQWANLHRCIDSTLNIVASEIKYKAEIIKEYGQIPDIECLPSQLNQVIMNLLINAAQAIDAERGKITIRTGQEQETIWMDISDTGCGISQEIISRMFDPFFTTKPIGKGTGLGLSLSYGIVQKHLGHIDVKSEVGKGTTFRVVLPIQHKAIQRKTTDV